MLEEEVQKKENEQEEQQEETREMTISQQSPPHKHDTKVQDLSLPLTFNT